MISKTNAVKMSIRKWERIVAAEDEEEKDCGFCVFRDQLYPSPPCHPWYPLDKAGICATDPDGLYQQWEENSTLELAQKILAGIRKEGAKWLEGDRKEGSVSL